MADQFYNAIRQDLIMIKNDTMQFGFQIAGLKGARPSQITFTVKSNPDNTQRVFRKSLNRGIMLREYDEENDILIYSIRVAPSDTENVDVGRYYYDLQVDVNEDVLTLMKGRLTIEYEVTSGQAPQPSPGYDNGDPIKYPRADAAGVQKLYTETYISDIGAAINEATGASDKYTTQEMSAAIRALGAYVPFEPTFTETIIGQDGNGGDWTGNVYLAENWDSYKILKIQFVDSRDTSRVMYYYTTPAHLKNIKDVEGYIRLSLRHPDITAGYVNYSLSETEDLREYLRRRVTGNFYIAAVYGLTGSNCTIQETNILISSELTNVDAEINTTVDLFNLDLIFVTLNQGNYTDCTPAYSVISPYKSTMPFKNNIEYHIDDPYRSGAIVHMGQHYMSAAKYLTVTGIKFVKN